MRDNLPGLVSNSASNAINKSEQKISGKGALKAGKGFTLFISNEDVNDIIKIINSLEVIVLTDSITEKVKHEIKKQEGRFLPALLGMLTAPLVILRLLNVSITIVYLMVSFQETIYLE